MKKVSRIFLIVSVLAAMLLNACGATSAVNADSSVGAGKGKASPVEFTGVIDVINGNQWVVNGQTITVDPAVVKDGPFNVGDKVKVEADVQTDGSIVITRVETPSAPVAGSTDVPVATDASLSTPQAGSTPDPAAGIVFDDSGNEAFGTVDGFDGTTIVIGGQSFTVANGAEIKDTIAAGDFVKVEFILNSDGTLSIREMQLWDPAAVGSGNSGGSDDGPNHDLNDDHGDDDQNDDDGNDDEDHDQNDDHGGSGNDD